MSFADEQFDLLVEQIDEAIEVLAMLGNKEDVPLAAIRSALRDLSSARQALAGVKNEMTQTSDELTAIKLRSKSFCVVCWTSSFAPCERDFPDAVPDGQGGWMVCEMCNTTRAVEALRNAVV